jgi:predicted TIM-barrel fold metal-dependent hydrolase
MDDATNAAPILTEPSRPRRPLPAGACDCHAHLFGPFDRFPPDDTKAKTVFAPFEAYQKMLDRMGFAHAVIVQPAAYDQNHRLMLDALERSRGRFRAVGVKDPSVSDAELADMHARGFRGLRFNELVAAGEPVALGALERLAPRLRELGWHAQLYALCERLVEILPKLLSLRVPLVIDHIARVGPSDRTTNDPAFRALVDRFKDGEFWIKLTAYRNSKTPPKIDDIRPFHEALVRANPDRVIWGSDWPYLSMLGSPPDTGRLIDYLIDWTPDDMVLRKILVDNPKSLYDF